MDGQGKECEADQEATDVDAAAGTRGRADLAVFFEAGLDLHCIADVQGHFLELSAEWERTLGYSLAELRGTMFLDLVHPEDLGGTREALSLLADGRCVLNFENRYRCKNGTFRWIEWRSLPRGEIIYASARDVTERKRMQEELLRSREQLQEASQMLRSVLDAIPDVIGIQDAKHRMVRYNRAGYAFLGLKPGEEAGRCCFELIGRAAPCEQCATTEALRTRQPGRVTKYLSDASIWLDCRSYPVLDDDGRVEYVVEHLRDISDLKNAEEKLRTTEQRLAHAQKMEAIGQLAGGIAHDFNNQLCGVMGYAELLRLSLSDRPDLQESASAIVQAAQRAAELTAQLLAFARRGKAQNVDVDLHATIAEVASMLEHSIDKRIRIRRVLDATQATTRGDPSQIQNALLNIALNARDAMPDGGQIEFRTRNVELGEMVWELGPFETSPGNFVCVSITDTGSGMSPEVLGRIFEPFFTTKPEGRGTGMGLAAVHGTLWQHRGAIRVSSTPAQGSTFELFFPAGSGAPASDRAPDLRPGRTRSGHVLVIDDDAVVRRVVRQILQGAGHTVSECQTGFEAVAFYREHWRSIDVVLLDMIMPELAGEATWAALHEINPRVAVVLSSGNSVSESIRSLLERSHASFLPKPFRVHELLGEVHAVLEREAR